MYPGLRILAANETVLWLDGVHAHELGSGRAEFCEHGEVTDGDVAGLVSAIADRVPRLLRRVGKWPATGEAADSDDDATDLMLQRALHERLLPAAATNPRIGHARRG